MKKTVFIWFVLSILLLGFSAFIPLRNIEVPKKKIKRAIAKVWKLEYFEVVDFQLPDQKTCSGEGCWLKVNSNDETIGMVYIGRVNSCRAGGCMLNEDDKNELAFEYFDYFFLVDTMGRVEWVKVYNYQATQGHEVMSRGWLNQFKGLTKNQELIFGHDIESISGATVSSSAITSDIQKVLKCM